MNYLEKKKKINMLKHTGIKNILPPNYQEVEYITPNGKAFINTQVLSADRVVLKLQCSIPSGYYGFIGYISTDKSNYIQTNNHSECVYYYGSNGSYNLPSANKTIPYTNIDGTIQLTDNQLQYNDITYGTFTQGFGGEDPNPLPLYLCALNLRGTSVWYSPPNTKYYGCTLGKENTTVRQFVPCYRKSDGVIGMYDLCGSICQLTNSPFYTNAGTDTFLKGDDIN